MYGSLDEEIVEQLNDIKEIGILKELDWKWLFSNPGLNSDQQEINRLVELAITFRFKFKKTDLDQYAKNFISKFWLENLFKLEEDGVAISTICTSMRILYPGKWRATLLNKILKS